MNWCCQDVPCFSLALICCLLLVLKLSCAWLLLRFRVYLRYIFPQRPAQPKAAFYYSLSTFYFLHVFITICNGICIDVINFCLPCQIVSPRRSVCLVHSSLVGAQDRIERTASAQKCQGILQCNLVPNYLVWMLALLLTSHALLGKFFSSAVRLGQQQYQLLGDI